MKPRLKHIAALALLLMTLLATPSSAQYYMTGQDRGNIRWKEIETEYFRLIFPSHFEAQALKIASFCDTFAVYNKKELQIYGTKRQSKTPIIIHSSGSYSNGVSAWAPKRIEFWPCPPQKGYSQLWMQQLVLHEYRHELQMQAINQNFVGGLTSIFGEHISGLAVGLFVPEWFLEGDATWAETVLSTTGRGRQSNFLTPAQVLVTQQKTPNYYQMAFGSYKDYTFDNYLGGYLLVSYDKTKNDTANFWQNGLKRVPTKFWTLSPFYRGLKFKAHYDSAMAFWKDYWTPYFDTNQQVSSVMINRPQKHLTNYYLAGITDTSVFALKKGNRCPSALVEIMPDGNEHLLLKTGNVCNNYLNHNGSHIAWTEYATHSRWNVYYSNLVVYNTKTDQRKILTKHRNIFSPSISENGRIVALETNDSATWRLIFFDSTLCEMPDKILLPDSLEYQHPTFSAGGDSIFLSAVGNNGRYILLVSNIFSNASANIDIVAGPFWHNIRHLRLNNGKLYYLSDYSGVSRIAILTDGEETIISDNCYGLSSFELANNDTLFFSQFTSKGISLFTSNLPKCMPNKDRNFNSEIISTASARYAIPANFSILNSNNCQSKDYSHWKHLFNFHSWAPLHIDADNTDVGLGISAMSQNELSNSILQSSLKWDYNNMKPAVSLDYQYLRYYPKIAVRSSYSGHQTKSGSSVYNYNIFSSGISASVPFRYFWHNHNFSMNLMCEYGFSQIYFTDPVITTVPYMNTLATGASFVHSTAQPTQYLYNPWLQSLSITVGYGFGNIADISKIALSSNLHFPSPIETHTIRLYAGFQSRTNSLFSFSNSLKTPRGFKYLNPNNIASSLQLSYDFPISYPDKAWGPVAYFKRIYATFFCDGMLLHNNKTFEKSLGTELHINGNIFMISTPINSGVRISYLPDYKNFIVDFLFSVDV